MKRNCREKKSPLSTGWPSFVFYAESLFHTEHRHLEKSEAKGGDSSLQNSIRALYLFPHSPSQPLLSVFSFPSPLTLSRHGGAGGGGSRLFPQLSLPGSKYFKKLRIGRE